MKAAFIHETGYPECIRYGDLPQPEPRGREVLVRVRAAAVNPIDTYIRNGKRETYSGYCTCIRRRFTRDRGVLPQQGGADVLCRGPG